MGGSSTTSTSNVTINNNVTANTNASASNIATATASVMKFNLPLVLALE
jgi:hypothetical protein